ncbi:hypothetical protein ScPMuIL_008467 [Solemya velum]
MNETQNCTVFIAVEFAREDDNTHSFLAAIDTCITNNTTCTTNTTRWENAVPSSYSGVTDSCSNTSSRDCFSEGTVVGVFFAGLVVGAAICFSCNVIVEEIQRIKWFQKYATEMEKG